MATPAKPVEQLDLQQIWLFSTCTKSQLRLLHRHLEEVPIAAGRVLCEEGEVGREFFVIAQGQAIVRRKGRKVATLGPGNYFGELALLDRQPRSATVVADSDVLVLVLDQRAFNGLLETIPGFAHRLLVAMAARLRAADAKAL